MSRVKRGVSSRKHRKNIISRAKGYKWGRKKLIKLATQATLKAGIRSYEGRKDRKRALRATWITRLNNALRLHGMSYSVFVHKAKVAKIEIDRKMLADIAVREPQIFEKIVAAVKK